ncbi:hypothetical protein H0H81_002961 [Sphagnurus paluster]|uniref:Uncharacterized protein n=1 Tax=Sphagnurus paluster TaxID=117069 RepID=A0A9P7GQV6_9AGAR|nr:hypothetical protein H0H81_002961 [Sphagnurus paluster]
MSTAFGDNSTIIGDERPGSGSKPTSDVKDYGPRRAGDGYGKSTQPKNDFVATVDYTIEERPFFVPIGKAGIIAALEKLDRQLVQASLLLFG